jgi:tRNA nucleotidyltransferase/poly(A) polymerase
MSVSTGEILDLTGKGVDDIHNKIIRCVGNPQVVFHDDGLRLMRAVRQAEKFGFSIENETKKGIQANAYRLESISKERIQDELNKMLLLPVPSQSIVKLHNYHLLRYIIPELENCLFVEQNKYHDKDVFYHIMNVLDKTPANLTVRLAALLHDVAKPDCKTVGENGEVHFYMHEEASADMTKTILKRLKYSNEYVDDVYFLIKHHMRTKSFGDDCKAVKDKSIRKFVDQVGDKREMLLQLIDADNKSHAPNYCLPNQVENIKNKINELGLTDVYKIKLPVNGNDIMEYLNIEPCEQVKDMLKIIQKQVYINPNITKEKALKTLNQYKEKR